jgi:hypothetical protein
MMRFAKWSSWLVPRLYDQVFPGRHGRSYPLCRIGPYWMLSQESGVLDQDTAGYYVSITGSRNRLCIASLLICPLRHSRGSSTSCGNHSHPFNFAALLLPSMGPGLVTTITLGGVSSGVQRRLVRRVR